MKRDLLYIFLFGFFIWFFILFFYCNKRTEGFFPSSSPFPREKQETKTVFLLGDSILNNSSYVSHGKSVKDLLKQQLLPLSISVSSLAKDGATIQDVLQNQLPIIHSQEYLNDSSTILFLSVGGNDILNYFIQSQQNANISSTLFLQTIFHQYKILIQTIQKRMNRARLVLLDIYFPQHSTEFLSILQDWNQFLVRICSSSSSSCSVLPIHKILKEPGDFVQEIEPSEKGGEKITDVLLSVCV